MNVLIIGLGDIGATVARSLAQSGHTIYGVRRSSTIVEGIRILQADVADATAMTKAVENIPHAIDIVLYCVAAKTFNEETYTQSYPQGLQNTLTALETASHVPSHVFYVSSTSVFNQNDQGWVDESSPTLPSSFSGKILLEAENNLKNHNLNSTSIRFSGIYGPGRNRLLTQVMEGAAAPIEPPLYTNRIHRDDCVGVILYLIQIVAASNGLLSTQNENLSTDRVQVDKLPEVLIATDCEPASLFDVYTFLAMELNAPAPTIGPANNRRTSKRLSNKRLLDLGYSFKYPSYQTGYLTVIDSFLNKNSL